MSSLREQLGVDRRSSAGGADGSPPPQCFRVSERTLGVKFTSGDTVLAFPYSQYLYSQLMATNALDIRFATHRVTLFGRNLDMLQDELNAQRLHHACTLPRREREAASAQSPWIDRIEISESRHRARRIEFGSGESGTRE